MNQIPDADIEYSRVLRSVLDNGVMQEGRNGMVKVQIGNSMRLSLANGQVPFITTKRLAWKTCLRELLWFIRGSTSATELAAEGCHIWDANASRDFLDSRGLTEYSEGELGPVYGHQWRRWGASVHAKDGSIATEADGSAAHGIDQLGKVIEQLRDPVQRHSRRLIVSAWNVGDLDKMALPPCHLLFQFHVTGEDELSCTTYQRSVDVGLGLPFNMASYGMLTHFVAKAAGLRAKELVIMMGNVHVYDDHINQLKDQVTRKCAEQSTRIITENLPADIDQIKFEDVLITGYTHQGNIGMKMRA